MLTATVSVGAFPLAADLAVLGVVPAGGSVATPPASGPNGGSGQFAKDTEKLATDLKAASKASSATAAEFQTIAADDQTIAVTDGFKVNEVALKAVASETAYAIASGSYAKGPATAAALQKQFTALFKGSAVSTATIDKTYADMVTVITASKVTTTTLSTIAADEAAILADLAAIQKKG